jgi:hypothetical protein
MGRDILSDSETIVMFSDRSWITDKASFNAKTGETISFNGENIDEYILEIDKKVKDKFKYSAMILETNYYSILK